MEHRDPEQMWPYRTRPFIEEPHGWDCCCADCEDEQSVDDGGEG